MGLLGSEKREQKSSSGIASPSGGEMASPPGTFASKKEITLIFGALLSFIIMLIILAKLDGQGFAKAITSGSGGTGSSRSGGSTWIFRGGSSSSSSSSSWGKSSSSSSSSIKSFGGGGFSKGGGG